ncbi:MAG: hypothetical protein LBF28_00100, partial [Rickettsiales bacterium]|nr:hypothetical protein [Rickettsiales bacterium]
MPDPKGQLFCFHMIAYFFVFSHSAFAELTATTSTASGTYCYSDCKSQGCPVVIKCDCGTDTLPNIEEDCSSAY